MKKQGIAFTLRRFINEAVLLFRLPTTEMKVACAIIGFVSFCSFLSRLRTVCFRKLEERGLEPLARSAASAREVESISMKPSRQKTCASAPALLG